MNNSKQNDIYIQNLTCTTAKSSGTPSKFSESYSVNWKSFSLAMISPLSTEYPTPATFIPNRLANPVREMPNSRTAQWSSPQRAAEYPAKLGRSQPVFALTSFTVVRLAIHPYKKWQGILAKTNNKKAPGLTLFCCLPFKKISFTSISQISATLDAIKSRTSLRTPMRNMSGNVQSC